MTSFGRVWAVTVGTVRVPAPLRVAFEIERTRHPPGKAKVRLWNLTRDHQSQIEQATAAQVVIEAGYEGERGAEVLFSGELFRARGRRKPPGIHTEREMVDAVTHVEARDGGRAYQQARIEQSFQPGVSVTTVLRACADALGVGRGNVDSVAAVAELVTGGSTFTRGTVLSGPVRLELTRLLDAFGLSWSVQLGTLQVLRRGASLDVAAVRLAVDTGLIGDPEPGTRGQVKATSLLNSNLVPGRVVLLESRTAEGRFTVNSMKVRGDSHAQDWYSDVEMEAA